MTCERGAVRKGAGFDPAGCDALSFAEQRSQSAPCRAAKPAASSSRTCVHPSCTPSHLPPTTIFTACAGAFWSTSRIHFSSEAKLAGWLTSYLRRGALVVRARGVPKERRRGLVDRVHQHDGVGLPEVARRQSVEDLLPCRVPQLQADLATRWQLDRAGVQVDADRCSPAARRRA